MERSDAHETSSEFVELDDTAFAVHLPNLVAATLQTVDLSTSALKPVFEEFPFGIYVTDAAGLVTYSNPAAAEFAGRIPQPGADRWCVTWKLFSLSGSFIPHHECPMAQSIKTRQPVRGVRAVAKRPDGRFRTFMPFPTPLTDRRNGRLLGAFNMFMPIADLPVHFSNIAHD